VSHIVTCHIRHTMFASGSYDFSPVGSAWQRKGSKGGGQEGFNRGRLAHGRGGSRLFAKSMGSIRSVKRMVAMPPAPSPSSGSKAGSRRGVTDFAAGERAKVTRPKPDSESSESRGTPHL
jgi:hypothetical protein